MDGRHEKAGARTRPTRPTREREQAPAAQSEAGAALAEWHRTLAKASGIISLALVKRSISPRTINAVASELRPTLRDMERLEAMMLAREEVAKKPARTRVKVTRGRN